MADETQIQIEVMRKQLLQLTAKVAYLEEQNRNKTFQIEQLRSNLNRLAKKR